MLRYSILLLLFVLLIPAHAVAQGGSGISYPPETELLRGTIQIRGTANHPDFWKYELAAASAGTQNWFNIGVSETPVNNGVLGAWDTRSVSDGPYTIRLRIVKHDGNYDEFLVQRVQVGNAGPPPTPTLSETPTPTITPTPKPPTATPVVLTPEIPTPTPAPTNTPSVDVAVAPGQDDESGGGASLASLGSLRGRAGDALVRGVGAVLLVFLTVGVFFGVKRLLYWLYYRLASR